MRYLHLLIISLKLKYNMRVLNKISTIKQEAIDVLEFVNKLEEGIKDGKK